MLGCKWLLEKNLYALRNWRMTKSLLVTGGAGYIGSHACVALLEAGYSVVVLDNLSNGSCEAISRVEKICERKLSFIRGDIRDLKVLEKIFNEFDIEAVLHFAGLKSVSESVKKPLEYYDNNFSGSVALCQAMQAAGVYKLIFSSSATVYGDQSTMPVSEESPLNLPTNPYGRSKLMVENMLGDLASSDPYWSIAILRYFNPVGAHESGLIGEDPSDIPSNLLPYITQVAVRKLENLTVFGDDYPTKDGTGVRDYIHVVDLVNGHLCALEKLVQKRGVNIWNLGTGVGVSVLEMINAFEKVTGSTVPYTISSRRDGDVAECWADPAKANNDLKWHASYKIEKIIEDAWRWQKNNPDGYGEVAPVELNRL